MCEGPVAGAVSPAEEPSCLVRAHPAALQGLQLHRKLSQVNYMAASTILA